MIFNKGQVQGQIFIYILTLIIAGVIFIFGYNAVSAFSEQIEKSKLLDFETDMNSVFDKIGSEYQSYEEYTFYLPSSYSKVCFLDRSDTDFNNPNSALMQNLLNNHSMIYHLVTSNINHNVFVYSTWLEKSFYVGDIKIISRDPNHPDYPASPPNDESFICYELFGGKLDIYIRGLGDRAEIEESLPDAD